VDGGGKYFWAEELNIRSLFFGEAANSPFFFKIRGNYSDPGLAG
jgi:hypothetical protein